MSHLGARDIDPRLEELLVNGIRYVFQGPASDHVDVMLNEFEYVPEREWMLICDRLYEMLNATQDMEIRWAAVKTFEYNTEAIGPQKVLDID
nr:splicing factor 3B subunit 1 [Tanacetum cinerariifolium]